ncbi:ferrous iron transport protein B [Nitratiruptor sp. YY08-26]|uniref:ferrous iron transport protein B n=1 Tax=unclassified Nitratiruptor TaxID=2624044 RepID=UPI0019150C07|nr:MULTISPECIES: ferrous iron transport protein B [unclassified Nitratiruptor]BCD62158.1 ferrous iron transport protein B [Nitratiruptor sp. YY08-13]BCD66094.1 ferrous iron transport protein B [Nitratiruptor sp. YY08-26]
MKQIKVAMVGQPNVGKSSIINAMSNARLHVGNFTGVTVEKKEVRLQKGEYDINIVDLPGIYSLNAYTPEEQVTKNYLLYEDYDLIINVVDANVLQRNLILTLQLLDMNPKMILVVNMIDEVEKQGGMIDAVKLSELIGRPVVLASAKEKRGVDDIIDLVIDEYNTPKERRKIFYNEKIEDEITSLQKILLKSPHFTDEDRARFYVIRLFEKDEDVYKEVHDLPIFLEFHEALGKSMHRLQLEFDEESVADIIANERNSIAKSIVMQVMQAPRKESLTDKIDKILIHPIFGLPLFLFFMWALFQITFEVGSIPVDYIDQTFTNFADWLKGILPPGDFNSVITDGVIPAVGSVIMFLPNILILFLGINLLEQTGYMARAAFLLDGFLKKFGLQGKAFIPLVSGFGCTVPAYMAARTLKNPKDRLITMLVLGFMNCSARLPVYVLLIAAFFPTHSAGNVLFAIYIGGAILGLIVAKILRIVLFKGEPEPFVMEMPPYRFPSMKALAMELWIKAKLFLKKAGTFIAGAAMIIWFLSSYPKSPDLVKQYEAKISAASTQEQKIALQNELAAKELETSYLGKFGKTIEPIFAPLGFDWRMSVAVISGLAAKEVVVSTLATLYAVGEADEKSSTLITKLRQNVDFKAAIALIVIIMIYSPCVAAMSTFYAEIPQWAWRTFYTIYPNVLAWFMAFGVYRVLALLGY